MPQLGDPNFHRAVVLVIEHSPAGAMGLVLNRASPLTLRELADGQAFDIAPVHEAGSVFIGGPVEPQRGFVLHDSRDVDERHQILPGLFLSVTVDALAPILHDPEAQLRFCMGYSGWGPKQLEREINQGTWLFTEGASLHALGGDPGRLWESTLRGMGVDPATLLTAGRDRRGMN